MIKLNDFLSKIIEVSIDGIFIEYTRGNILECNESGAKMFGYIKAEIIGKNIKDLVADPDSNYIRDVYTKEDLFEKEYKERVCIKKNGSIFPTEINSQLVTVEGKEYLIAFIRDITNEIDIRNKLYYMSSYDELTNIMNRRAISKYVKNFSKISAIAMIDLDDFKLINDKYGHNVGDKFLVKFSEILRKEPTITPGRIGGEEFVAVFDSKSLEEAYETTNKILKEANRALSEYGGIKFSAGIVWCNENNFDLYVEKADKLLYKAKSKGKNYIQM